jgi:hypothetical protein
VGQRVKAGEPVGYVGDSGNAENAGSHLHFELHTPDGTAVDAYSSLVAASRAVLTDAAMASTRPFGFVDVLAPAGPRAVRASGWAVDRTVPSPSAVTLLVDGNPIATFTADGLRPDVGAAFPGVGAVHGFARTVAGLAPGLHHACLVAHNAGAGGGSARLGCADLAVSA